MPDYETIRAAVAGEKWAVEKVIDCYADEIDQLATIEKKQPDGRRYAASPCAEADRSYPAISVRKGVIP